MNYKICLCFILLCLVPFLGKADKISKAYKKLLHNKPEQARVLLDKSLDKNPQNAGAKYVYALYFLHASNPVAHLDSAYAYILAAQKDFPQMKRQWQKHWRKIGINQESILHKKLFIDSLAFSIAADTHSISAYQYFINHYPTALQCKQAVETRNALAFAQAKQENTYESYKKFMDTYPDAREAHEAKESYDVLLFEFITQDGSISSYEDFTVLYPQSPFKKLAEQHIFEIYTVPHTINSYADFIKQYPANSFVNHAWNWIYFLYKQEKPVENFSADYPGFYEQAYIEKLTAVEKLTYYPVYEEEKYGFVDANGTLQIPIRYDSVATQYFCEGVKEDFILVNNKGKVSAIDKTGKQIVDESFENINQLEDGFLLVEKAGKQGVFHQAGFELLPPQYNQIELLDDAFFQVRVTDKMGLTSMNGHQLTPVDFDDISSLGEKLILFEKDNKYTLLLHEHLLTNQKDTSFNFKYTKVEWIKKGYIKVYTDSLQGILTTQLKPVIPLTKASIQAFPNGWSVEKDGNIQIYATEGQLLSDSVFTSVTGNASFYAVQKNDRWSVLKSDGKWYGNTDFDEVTLLSNNLFLVRQKGKLFSYSQTGKLIKLDGHEKLTLQTLPDYPGHSWMMLENKKGKKGIFDVKTSTILTARYDDIRVWNPDLYKTELNGKFGLINAKGKTVLPAIYDGLDYQEGLVATLKNGKFGLIDLAHKITIAPQYSALLRKYDIRSAVYIASKEGKYGLISADNKPISDFAFDEIRFWQQEVALVRQAQTWYLYHYVQKRYIFKPMDDIQYIKQEDGEIVLKVYMDKMYGILSNTKGLVLNCEYDDLTNVGNAVHPLYVGEKYVNDADVYLVFYINREGKPMRRQIFNPSKYQRILCEEL